MTRQFSTMRLVAVLFALATYLVALTSAAATTYNYRHLAGAAAPVDLERRQPPGSGGSRGGSLGFGGDNFSSPSSGGGDGSTSSPRRSTCGTGTAVGTMWISESTAYTCAPVSGVNYCVAASLTSVHAGRTLCAKHADCGAEGAAWCIQVNGGGSACWSVASGCDGYYHGAGAVL